MYFSLRGHYSLHVLAEAGYPEMKPNPGQTIAPQVPAGEGRRALQATAQNNPKLLHRLLAGLAGVWAPDELGLSCVGE